MCIHPSVSTQKLSCSQVLPFWFLLVFCLGPTKSMPPNIGAYRALMGSLGNLRFGSGSARKFFGIATSDPGCKSGGGRAPSIFAKGLVRCSRGRFENNFICLWDLMALIPHISLSSSSRLFFEKQLLFDGPHSLTYSHKKQRKMNFYTALRSSPGSRWLMCVSC